jgi:hypothetical protein
MRLLIIIFVLAFSLTSFAQQKRFTIQAKVVDQKGAPISDVYVVNLVSNEKVISHSDGIFTIRVLPSDSLIFSHISYFRKIADVYTLLLDPVVKLYSESVDIPEVQVTPDQQSDYENAMKNLLFLKEYKAPEFLKIQEESDPVSTITTEHNELMRSEASSISLIRLSPSKSIEKLVDKVKKTDRSNDYYSTRKQKKLEENEEEKKE